MFPDLTRDDIFRLETERLWLRWPRASDAAAITAFASLPEVAQMTDAIPHPYPAGEADRFIFNSRAENAAGKALHFALTRKNGPRALFGLISAIIEAPGEIALGYIDTVFGLTSATRIVANARINNPGSRAVLEKSGFVYIDSGLDLLPARGGLHPCDRFELTRSKWRTAHGLRTLPAMTQQAPTTAVLSESLADPKAKALEY
jgi:RimJ/RimL family protein N-acetyltransferase